MKYCMADSFMNEVDVLVLMLLLLLVVVAAAVVVVVVVVVVGVPPRNTNMTASTGLCKFVQNISSNIWNIRKIHRLKTSISYSITIS